MARRSTVFVRPLAMDEGRKLARITSTAKNPIRMRRGRDPDVRPRPNRPDITSLLRVSDDYALDVIPAFNEQGFDALEPKSSGDARRRSLTRVALP